MAVPTKDLVDLPDDVLAVMFDQILVTIGVWKMMNLRVLCRLFNTIITKTLCLNYMANSKGPVDDALKICLKYPDSKLPGIAHLFIHLEMKYNPHHIILSPVYCAIQCVKTRSSNIQTRDKQTAFEIQVCHAIEEHLKWGSNDDRDPGVCGRRRLQFCNAAIGEDDEARLDIQTTLIVAIIAGVAFVTTDTLGRRPLHLAANYGRTEIIEILLECGADLSSVRPYLIHQSKRFTKHLQKFICTFGSPLRIAALNGHLEAVKLLTKPRFNAVLPYPKEEIKELPIHCAAYKGRPKVVQLLLENGAHRDRYAAGIRVRHDIMDAICFAVSKGHEDVAHVLLNHDFSLKDREYNALIEIASFSSQHHIMSLLLKNAAVSDTCINRTALSYAIINRDILSVRLLVEAGHPIEILKDGKPINYNSSPILLAMKCGWPHILEYLFSVGSEKIDPLDEEQFPLDSNVRNDFTSGKWPRRHAKQPYQLWYTQGRY
ncbi:hypothetical protein BHYA_0056g00550 [Botrytis hyacinthi]|uniref:F-box domain-containing protein n=1 Tax=Botrytis hyacinthi TaxID=278943 RepID=A0A4Z1H1R0_9HELO|nr:hypothetical protein BHYA_0056g00550 [Botrytis hyacinthi]